MRIMELNQGFSMMGTKLVKCRRHMNKVDLLRLMPVRASSFPTKYKSLAYFLILLSLDFKIK